MQSMVYEPLTKSPTVAFKRKM